MFNMPLRLLDWHGHSHISLLVGGGICIPWVRPERPCIYLINWVTHTGWVGNYLIKTTQRNWTKWDGSHHRVNESGRNKWIANQRLMGCKFEGWIVLRGKIWLTACIDLGPWKLHSNHKIDSPHAILAVHSAPTRYCAGQRLECPPGLSESL
jgi:hypothetical protein